MAIHVHIIGSGICGLSCAHYLQQAGCKVTLTTASDGPDASCCSWWAGGMLAPHCEQESAEALIGVLGQESILFWKNLAKKSKIEYHQQGTLVVASIRDQPLLRSFAQLTQHHQHLQGKQITALEPDLTHFSQALFYADEAHLNPRLSTQVLWQILKASKTTLNTQTYLNDAQIKQASTQYDWQIDCRGLRAQKKLTDLRGVKGEMLHIYSPEVQLKRPIRLLHPRYPLYILPRSEQQFMVGATMIEVNNRRRASVRSMLELLSAAYSVHPAFAEAEIIEIGVDARPAFDDNLPKIRRYGNHVFVNGLYRHGYLVAPAIARRLVDLIIHNSICHEVVDENYPEWKNH